MSTCVHGLVCAVKHVVTKQVSRRQVYVQSCVMPSESYPTLLTGSCLVMDHQCIVFTSFSQPVIAGCCGIYVAGIFDNIIV